LFQPEMASGRRFWFDAFEQGGGYPASRAVRVPDRLLDDAVHSMVEEACGLFFGWVANPPAEEQLGQVSASFRKATLDQLMMFMYEAEERLDASGAGSRDALKSELDRLERLHRLWHLCEVAHLSSSRHLSLDLCVWLNHLCSFGIESIDRKAENGELQVSDAERNLVLRDSALEPKALTFWPAVYRLALQGRLSEVWKLIQVHSEVDRAFQDRREATEAWEAWEELGEILMSHPYASYLVDQGQGQLPTWLNLAVELKRWQNRVQQARYSARCREYYGAVPEIDVLFEILNPAEGDVSILEAHCDKQWEPLIVAELLYVYPPPVSRENLLRHIKDALKRNKLDEQQQQLFVEFVEVMSGSDVTKFLTRMYHLSMESNKAQKSIGSQPLVGLLAVAFVCFLLQHGSCDRQIGDIVLPDFGCTFYERLMIEIVRDVSLQSCYSLNTLVCFVQCLPRQDMQQSIIQSLVPSWPVANDQEAYTVSQVLEFFQLDHLAQKVLLDRGQGLAPEEAAKALEFYINAGDVSKCLAELDLVLFDTTQAFASCSSLGSLRRWQMGRELAELVTGAPRSIQWNFQRASEVVRILRDREREGLIPQAWKPLVDARIGLECYLELLQLLDSPADRPEIHDETKRAVQLACRLANSQDGATIPIR